MASQSIENYTVFDVETPNAKNDSICSIGIVRVEKNKVIYRNHFYVNPEDRFDSFNTRLHGISSSLVLGEPNFKKIWENISHYFINEVVIAHNANFDLKVLSKCFSNYAIEVPDFYSACTLKLSRRWVKELGHHRLDDMCCYFRVDLHNHHNALDDALACQGVFECIKNEYGSTYDDVDMVDMKKTNVKKAEKPVLAKSLFELSGLLEAMAADGVIDGLERVRLKKWVDHHKKYVRSHPYNEIIPWIREILIQGRVDKVDLAQLHGFVHHLEGVPSYSTSTQSIQELKGIIEGIHCNGKVSKEEFDYLWRWLNQNKHMEKDYSFDFIFKEMTRYRNLDQLTPKDEKNLLIAFEKIINPVQTNQDCEKDYAGKKVCLTGDFRNGSKSEIALALEQCGAEVTKTVTLSTDILIVGGEGSARWSYGDYGSKVKKAMEMQGKGKPIKIISEEDYFKNMI